LPAWRATCPPLNGAGEERADQKFAPSAMPARPLPLAPFRRAAIILEQNGEVRILELGERQLRGVLHRARRRRTLSGAGERQDQADLHGPGPQRRPAGRLSTGAGAAAGAGAGARAVRVAADAGAKRGGRGRDQRGAAQETSPGKGQGHLGSFTPVNEKRDTDAHASSRARHLR
jgi:hypothetical protein